MELSNLKSYKKLLEWDSKLASQVEEVYELTESTINGISGCHNNYTMHDMNHGLRVAAYMECICFGIDEQFEDNIIKYNAFELALLILSAILHDIGMFIREEDRTEIKRNIIKYTTSLTFQGVMKVVNNNEEEAIKEIVRITHAQRIREFVDIELNGKTISSILMLDNKYNYIDDIIQICVAHGENHDHLKDMRTNLTKGSYSYNLQFLAASLRIADYIDLDKQRTPIMWYRTMRIEGFSEEEWEKHFIIHNEKKFRCYIDNKIQIFFDGVSSSAKIHRKYLKYIDGLRIELENTDELLNTQNALEKYKFRVSTKLDDSVQTLNFKYSDLRLNLDYSAITKLLMGKNIYGDSRLGLRELVQNAIDACELMKERIKTTEEYYPDPQVSLILSKNNNYVKIKDSGIGMTLNVVKKHFLNIGLSYYKSNEYYYENYRYKPIGQYGIGFLACFLLSDSVIVKTKYYDSSEINQIELEKNSEYVVTNTEETGNFFGTEITLNYKSFFSVFRSKSEVISFLEKYFFTSIPIIIKDIDEGREIIQIRNSCRNIIESRIEQDDITKFDTISCENYSKVCKGILKIREGISQSPQTVYNITNTEKYYLLDLEQKQFVLFNPDNNTLDGCFNLVEYTIIDNTDVYLSVKESTRDFSERRDAILSEGEDIHLIFPGNVSIDYLENEITINDTSVKRLIENSGFIYYEELIADFEHLQHIFIKDNNYIFLEKCSIGGPAYFEMYYHNNLPLFFYYKGVWINRMTRAICLLPYGLSGMGVINYNGDRVKLDVSRNSIIKGRKEITLEIANIVLLHRIKHSSNTLWKTMIDHLIRYNKNQIDYSCQQKDI